jgi:hypothetical protein
LARIYRIAAAVAVWAALLLQYALVVQGRGGEALIRSSINFFSYFTILANILCAVCLTWPKAAANPSLRGGAALYIAVTGAIYILILKNLWAPEGLHWVADTLLHYIAPALFLIDWLVLTPKGKLAWRSAVIWLAFPLVYGAWTLVHGARSGFWPYPFLDVGALGWSPVLVHMAAMSALFLGLGLILVLIDHLLGRLRRR